jgi:hypothetical protein
MLPCLCVMNCRCSILKRGVQLPARVHLYNEALHSFFLLLSWMPSCAWLCSNWSKYPSHVLGHKKNKLSIGIALLLKHFSLGGFFSIFVLPHQRCKWLDKCELNFSRLWGVGGNPEYYLGGFTDFGSVILSLQCLHKWSVPIISVVYRHILPPIGA